MILLIKAYEAMDKLDNYIAGMTGGYGLLGSPYDDMFHVSRVISINSAFYDPNDEDASYDKCMKILRDEDKLVEEKCSLMLGN